MGPTLSQAPTPKGIDDHPIQIRRIESLESSPILSANPYAMNRGWSGWSWLSLRQSGSLYQFRELPE